MNIKINKSIPHGETVIPPSKSELHRLLIIASFCKGETVINNFSYCDDIKATIECLQVLGANITVLNNTATVKGISPSDICNNTVLNCKDSGSTLRMLLPITLLSCKEISFTASKRLFDRTIDNIKKFLISLHVNYIYEENKLTVIGNIKADNYLIDCSETSQLCSGLCIALSLLKDSSIINCGKLVVSKPYIDLTVFELCKFGANVCFNNNCIFIKKSIICENRILYAEGDWSCAANFLVLNKFGRIKLSGLNSESIQADKISDTLINNIFNGFCEIDLTDYPDLGPILFVAAALSKGAVFKGINRLINKESNRLFTMITELNKCGILCTVSEDSCTVNPGNLHSPDSEFNTYNDHRVSMALSVLAAQIGGIIIDAGCVSKSIPDYFKIMRNLSIDFESL